MIKPFKIIYFAAILSISLFSACEKDGTAIAPKLKAINKNFNISGFVLGDTVEQYFDGVKIREYYGQVRTVYSEDQLAFVKDDINMELRKKSNGKTIYRQTFNINDEQNAVPKFFFDGITFSDRYVYPDPQGADYTVNFNFDFQEGSDPVDVVIDELEYYYINDKLVVVNTISYPIATNIKPGKFTEYFKINPIAYKSTSPTGSEFYPIVVIRNAKTKEYYINNDRDQSTVSMEIPYEGGSQGKVQSFYFSRGIDAGKQAYMKFYDLVQLFPR